MKPSNTTLLLTKASLLMLAGTLLVVPGLTRLARGEEQKGRPLFSMTDGEWTAFGADAQVRLTPEAARTRNGDPALVLEYKVAPKQFGAAVMPVPQGALTSMRSLRFWLKTDSSTAVAVLLSEHKPDGGNYTAVVWSPKDTWQKIELTPADFRLSDGPNDPKDSDGKLDTDQIEGVGILDLAPMFAAMGDNPNFPIAVDQRSGSHTLYVDSFEVRADAPENPSAGGTQSAVIDDFHRGTLNWFTPGGAELSLSASGNPLGRPALEAQYVQTEGRYIVLIHPISHVNLAGASRLDFDVASDLASQYALSVETQKPGGGPGARYNTTVEVPGHRKPVHETVSFADFKRDENGPQDSAARLDAGRIKSLSIADITGATSIPDKKNTLWLADIRAGAEGVAAQSPRSSSGTLSQPAHGHESQAMSMPMGQDSHQMPMPLGHEEDAHVTETMSHHHMHMGPHMKLTDSRPVNAEDQKKADVIVTLLREELSKYKDYHAAIQDGYLPYLPNLPQPEYHFTNYGYGYNSAFKFDPAHPTSLLYKRTGNGYELLGAMYTAREKATEDELNARVPLSVARWHLHVNICLPQGGMEKISDWAKFGPGGSIATEEACTAADGKFMPHLFGWMVHVYPFEQNPESIWAH